MEEMEMELGSDMSQYAFAMITALSLSLFIPVLQCLRQRMPKIRHKYNWRARSRLKKA